MDHLLSMGILLTCVWLSSGGNDWRVWDVGLSLEVPKSQNFAGRGGC